MTTAKSKQSKAEFIESMKAYYTTIPFPNSWIELIDSIKEVAHVEIDVENKELMIEFEAKDEYELALMVRDLEEGLRSNQHYVEFGRPTPR